MGLGCEIDSRDFGATSFAARPNEISPRPIGKPLFGLFGSAPQK
jgi:hypothetical protein